jgi:hypothetical protein
MNAGRILVVAGLLAAAGIVGWAALGGGPPAPPAADSGGTTAAPGAAPAVPAVGTGGAPAAPNAVPPAAAGEAGPAFSDPVQCKACHVQVWEEWSASMHAKSESDPEVRALSDNFKSTECMSCHMPQPIHSGPVGGRVFERSSRFETGVDCLSCHLMPDGGVAASRDVPGAPCRPRRVETLREAISCKGCHNQHYLVDEWETLFRTPDASRGALLAEGRPEGCLDCHMGPVDRPAGADGKARKGRDHVFKGGHYDDVLKKALTFDAKIEGGAVVAVVSNTGTGHRAPADSRHRSFNVLVTVTTAAGVKVQDRTEIAEYRMYYRAPPRENTNLRPGETSTSRLALPRGLKGKVLVELVYAMNPVKKDARDVRRVSAKEIDFDTTK